MKIIQYALVLVMVNTVTCSGASENNALRLQVFAIPGLQNLGSEQAYVRQLLDDGSGRTSLAITSVPTPKVSRDLGQDDCIQHVVQALREKPQQSSENQRTIRVIHATSQGAATAVTAFASGISNIDALVVEGVFATGNSAICHHTANKRGSKFAWFRDTSGSYRLGSYYWGPYAAKFAAGYWRYNPSGKQPLKSLKHIPQSTVVVIAHSDDDFKTSSLDARALYYGLREQGNEKVYLISKQGRRHTNVLDETDQQTVRAIFRHHGLLPTDDKQDAQTVDLTPYQPDPAQFKAYYKQLLDKEKNHKRLAYVLTGAAVPAAFLAAYCVLVKVIKR